MNKEIALYVNNHKEISDLNKGGFIRVFKKHNKKWNVIKETPFELDTIKKNIGLDTIKISEALETCKIFVAKEIPDLLYIMFESIGVSAWKMEGEQTEILDYVLEKEIEEAEEIKVINDLKMINPQEGFLPVEIGKDGYYILNLKELQDHDMGITTKQVLKPFLAENKFNELIITCSHIPFWLENELESLNLKFEASKTGENEYILIINHNK